MSRFLRKKIILLLPFLLVGVFLFGNFAHAATWASGIVSSVLGFIGLVLVSIGGGILTALMMILVVLASYNDFIKEAPITYGWVVIRDVCNMFFILIFLVISFATILRLESYNAKKMIPKLVLMAILINFSKTICGLIIDASQVVTLTFVDAFREAAGGNLANLLGINDLMKIKASGEEKVDAFSIAGAVILAVLYVAIAIIVVGALVVTLAFRTIMLWIYIVLSPLAYLCASFPQGKGYASKWWEDFTKYVVVGPVLAFFIWLSLASMGSVNIASKVGTDKVDGGGGASADAMGSEELTSSITQAGSYDHMLSFVIGVAMLVGGLMMAQQAGGAAGGAAGKAMGMIQSGKNWAQKKASDKAVGIGKAVGGAAWSGAKALDAAALGGGVARSVNWVKDKKGTMGYGTLGAAMGSIGGPIGMAVGVALGGVFGRFMDTSSSRRREQKAVLDNAHQTDTGPTRTVNGVAYSWNHNVGAYRDGSGNTLRENGRVVGRYGSDIDHNGQKYRRMDDDKFYRVNDAGELVDDNNSTTHRGGTTTVANGAAAARSSFSGMDLQAASQTDGFMRRLRTSYYGSTEKGHAARDAATNESVEKSQKDYANMSSEMLRGLMDIERDSSKRMAIAMTLAVKNGFENADQVHGAKDALQGSPAMLKRFNDVMNKKNMILNNTSRTVNGVPGALNEAEITRLISSGDVNWKDQDTRRFTPDALALMERHDPNNFSKTINSMIKTDRDRNNLEGHFRAAFTHADPAISGNNGLRRSFAKSFGRYTDAFTDGSGNIDAAEISNSLNSLSDITSFQDIDHGEFNPGNYEFISAVQGLNFQTIRRIATNDKVSRDQKTRIITAFMSSPANRTAHGRGTAGEDVAVNDYY